MSAVALPSTRPPAAPRGRTGARGLAALVLALFALVALSACTGQRDPTSYSDSVKENFVEGCRRGLSPTGVAATDPEAAASKRSCECLIGKLSADADKGGVPFKQFAAAQSKIRDDPAANPIEKVLPKYAEFVKVCAPGASGPVVPAGKTSTDSAPADSTGSGKISTDSAPTGSLPPGSTSVVPATASS